MFYLELKKMTIIYKLYNKKRLKFLRRKFRSKNKMKMKLIKYQCTNCLIILNNNFWYSGKLILYRKDTGLKVRNKKYYNEISNFFL